MKLLDRAFAILQAVAAEPQGIGVTEIAGRLGLAKSTTSRLMAALEAQGALSRSAENQFTIGPMISQLVANQPYQRTLSAMAYPILQRLAQQTGEAAALCVPEGFQVLYLDQVQSQQAIQVQDWEGARFPMHVLSAGKLFLAFGPAGFRHDYLRHPLIKYTENSLITPEALLAELEQVRAQGFAVTNEEYAPDLVALSVPLWDENDRCQAAINIFGPKFRLSDPERQKSIIALMLDATNQGNIQ